MDKNKKKNLRQAKLDMDARVVQLRGVVARGIASQARLQSVKDELYAAQQYLRTNRMYESVRYEDGEKTPEDLEREIEALEKDIINADFARLELGHAVRFYRAYHIVAFMPKLRDLKKRLTAAEYWVEQWQERINNLGLESDMDIDERAQEKDYLECEYSKAIEQVQQIRAQINDIRNIKYI